MFRKVNGDWNRGTGMKGRRIMVTMSLAYLLQPDTSRNLNNDVINLRVEGLKVNNSLIIKVRGTRFDTVIPVRKMTPLPT